MTPFEREFIKKCLDTLSGILADEEKSSLAIAGFTEDEGQNPRYQLTSKITEAQQWSTRELICFSAAYSETLYQTIRHYDNIDLAEVSAAQALLDKYIGRITSNTLSQRRIQSVISNIATIKSMEFKPKANPCSFFFTREAAVGLLATAALTATAVYLAK